MRQSDDCLKKVTERLQPTRREEAAPLWLLLLLLLAWRNLAAYTTPMRFRSSERRGENRNESILHKTYRIERGQEVYALPRTNMNHKNGTRLEHATLAIDRRHDSRRDTAPHPRTNPFTSIQIFYRTGSKAQHESLETQTKNKWTSDKGTCPPKTYPSEAHHPDLPPTPADLGPMLQNADILQASETKKKRFF